jgi:hypothetical protein
MIRSLTSRTNEPAVTEETAFVTAEDPLLVRAGDVEYAATKAAGCLLSPAVGDEVLVALVPNRRAFVLAVLVRDTKSAATIRVPGDLKIRSETGRVEVSAADGVSLASQGDISLLSSRLSVRTVAAELAGEALAVVGKTVACEIDRLKLVARTFDSVLDRLTQRARNVIRIVEESDHLRSARIDYVADKSVGIHGENTVVTAKDLVKVDGGQIHLG